MAKMRAVQVTKPNGPFELVQRDIPDPGAGQVRVKVQACGVCHSDSLVKEGLWSGISYPRVPGHEIVGVIDAVGPNVPEWKIGQRVGVGWHGGYCGHCEACRRGEFFACVWNLVTGISHDGGYADYTIAHFTTLALMPDELAAADAAPLLCAGVTTYNALRNSAARSGDLVAVLGLGGLGHLAVQYAVKMGYRTVGIARGPDKEPLAKKLGAWRYIDSRAQDPAAELAKLGGAKAIVATVTAGDAMSAVVGGLGNNGTLIVIGATPSLTVSPLMMISKSSAIKAWYSGTSIDSQDTLNFSVLTNVRSMNETFPLEKAAEAYDRMMSGKARFRAVLVM